MTLPDLEAIIHLCPACNTRLVLDANGDNGPADDRWACDQCGIEYPHNEFPLPPGYVKAANQIERERREEEQRAVDRERLDAWQKWAQRPPNPTPSPA